MTIEEEEQKNQQIQQKLKLVKKSLIEVLAESRNGISLAQLPINLQKKLKFKLQLNELGFAKLKDLVMSMSGEIKLELRGANHPFAYLINKGKKPHSDINSADFSTHHYAMNHMHQYGMYG